MGNVMETKASCDRPVAVVQPMQVTAKALQAGVQQEADEDDACPKANVMFHLFHYRQQMALKEHHVVKWATSKLLLTEELLKQQEQQQQQQIQIQMQPLDMPDLDSDAAWAERQLAMLTDDEEEEEDNDENFAPTKTMLGTELAHLMRYRMKLRNTIVQVAQEKMRKREKTKLKRLKRRTLISSKKPSNKDKHRY